MDAKLKVVQIDGNYYLEFKDKHIPVTIVDGNPVIKPKCEEITHPDGRKDVKIKVPCLTTTKVEHPEKKSEVTTRHHLSDGRKDVHIKL